ncbi:portal protein, partial [Enterobacter hormaechei]
MSKLLWALSTNQLFYEEGAIDEDRIEEVKREIAKPNGVIPLNAGAMNKIKVERNLDVAEAQIKLLELDAA